MGILYLKEHLSCNYYNKGGKVTFDYYQASEGRIHRGTVNSHYIIFTLKGSVNISCNEYNIKLIAGQMLFIHRHTLLNYQTLEDSEFIVVFFESVVNLCTKSSLSGLVAVKKTVKYEIKPFTINEQLNSFLELLTIYLKDGAKCSQLHDIKF